MWLESIGGLSFIGDVGAVGVLTLFVLAVLTGRLRPQRVVEEIRQDRDARVTEVRQQYTAALEIARVWEEAYRTTEKARADQAKVLEELLHTVEYLQDAVVTVEPSTPSETKDGNNV